MKSGRGDCVLVLASRRHSEPYISRILSWVKGVLGRARLVVEGQENLDISGCRSIVAVLATGGTEQLALELVERAAMAGTAVGLVGVPLANSTSSLAEVSPLVRGKATVEVLPGLNEAGAETLADLARGVRAAGRLRGARLLVIGGVSPWIPGGPQGLLEKLGVRVDFMGVDEFIDVFRRVEGGWPEAERLLSRAVRAEYVEGEPRRSLRVARAVFEAAGGYDGVSPGCIHFLEKTGANACLAHFLQELGGVTVGCEGDLTGLLSLMLVAEAQGAPAWQANIAGVGEDWILLSHCAPPAWYAAKFSLGPHFITGGSVTVRAELWLRRATLLRLSPGGDRALILEAPVISGSPGWEMQCETQLLLESRAGRSLVVDGLGNHQAVAAGGMAGRLWHAVRALGMEPVIL
ncbi:MAG: hypothetical protein F7C35_00095 [Desulfurococcales archaeon]|nr:hypothetical protein [Desulfurococcales archaeon]